MRKIVVTFCLIWILVFATLIYMGNPVRADWLEIDSATVTYRSFLPGGSDPLITQNPYQANKAMGKELNLDLNMDLFKYLYWNNTIHSMTDQPVNASDGQFRMIGLEFGLGVDLRRVSRQLPFSFGYYHYSRHLLDTASPTHFPVLDAIEFKIYLYSKDSK